MHRDVVRIAIRQKEGHVVQRCCVIAAQISEKRGEGNKKRRKEKKSKERDPLGGRLLQMFLETPNAQPKYIKSLNPFI